MKNSKGISLLSLIITIIVIVLLASIVMNSSSDTISNAQFAKFAHEFGEYRDQIFSDVTNIRTQLGLNGKILNEAQTNYMVANGLTDAKDLYVSRFTTPIGYVMPDTLMEIYGYKGLTNTASITDYLPFFSSKAYADETDDYSGPSYEIAEYYAIKNGALPIVGYVIDDGNISGYRSKPNNEDGSTNHEFYGDSNGAEYHFITSNGRVFTLPGFPVTLEDGTIQFHVSNETGAYYTIVGNSGLKVGAKNKVGDIIKELRPIQAEDLAELGPWGMDSDGIGVSSYLYDPNESTFGLPGRYTSIGDPTQWEYEGDEKESSTKSISSTAKKSNDKSKDKKEKSKKHFGWTNGNHYGWYKDNENNGNGNNGKDKIILELENATEKTKTNNGNGNKEEKVKTNNGNGNNKEEKVKTNNGNGNN